MKVNGHHQHDMSAAVLRRASQAPSDSAATNDAAVQASAPGPTSPAAAPVSTAAPAPVESTVEMAARKLPPGLVRVAARFEAIGREACSGGQSNALEQITRNLQRYIETQGLATPPVGSSEPIGAATPAVVELAGPVGS